MRTDISFHGESCECFFNLEDGGTSYPFGRNYLVDEMRGLEDICKKRMNLKEIFRSRLLAAEERDRIIRVCNSNLPAAGLKERVYRLYFVEGLTQREVADALMITRRRVQSIFKEEGWKGRHIERAIGVDEVRRFYDDEQMTQQEIANMLNVSRAYVYKLLRESRLEEYQRRTRGSDVDLDLAFHLYCEQGLSQRETAQRLGIGKTTFGNLARRQGWERAKPEEVPVDVSLIHSMYFQENVPFKEVVSCLGVSRKRVRHIFKEMGWRIGPRGAVLNVDEVLRLRNEKGKSNTEIAFILGVSCERVERLFIDLRENNQDVEQTRLHGSNKQRLEAKLLRTEIFGSECSICNVSKMVRMLALHRRDGVQHERELVWSPESLRKLNPEEWLLLCPPCHRSVHWCMDNMPKVLQKLGNLTKNGASLAKGREKLLDLSGMSVSELRFQLFGDNCLICDRHADDYKLVLHRRNGEHHHKSSTWTKEFLLTAEIDDWVMLCDRCHLSIHWLMGVFGTEWDRIESYLEMNDIA